MSFSPAQYEAMSARIQTGLTKLSGKLEEIGPAVQAATDHWYVTDDIAEALRWVGNKLAELGTWVLEKIKELAKGIAAPALFWFNAQDWQDQIKAKASTVAGATQVKALKAPQVWKGDAADAYTGAVWTQSGAAAQIGNLGSSVATALIVSAVAALAFYGALAVILYNFIATLVEALIAFGSEVFSWAGALSIVENCGVTVGMIKAAVVALVAALGTQAEEMIRVSGDAQDASHFPPHGTWPVGTA